MYSPLPLVLEPDTRRIEANAMDGLLILELLAFVFVHIGTHW
jgi:hypothetical protein